MRFVPLVCIAALALAATACGNTILSSGLPGTYGDVGADLGLADAATPTDDAATATDAEPGDVTAADGNGAPGDIVAGDSTPSGDVPVGEEIAVPGCAAGCDDGDACTVDTCDGMVGTCTHVAVPGCKPGPAPCQSTKDCKKGVCNPATLACVGCLVGADCGDATLACTANLTCAPATACQSDSQCKATQQVCSKTKGFCVDCLTANDCGAGLECKADLCTPVAKTCASSKDCPGVCDKAKGVCVGCVSDADCPTDGFCAASQLCQPDVCSGASCAGSVLFLCAANGSAFSSAKPCQDDNACTTDTCVAASGCSFAPNTAPCDDGNVCTTGDACAAGKCNGGPATNCDDKQPCTLDTCDIVAGCVHVASAAACDDANGCTLDSCGTSGCVHTPGGTVCDDGNPCTGEGACTASTCGAGVATNCNDNNECTTDSRDAKSGACQHIAKAGCVPTTAAPCASNADCNGGVCDTAAHACVACVSNNDCGAAKMCVKHACVAFAACVSDTQCKATKQVCNLGLGACVDCNNKSDCASSGEACVDQKCVAAPACKSSKDCAKVCDTSAGLCVECTSGADCAANQYCTASHTCAAKLCTGQACIGSQVFACKSDGTGYLAGVACSDGNLCTTDTCDAAQGCTFTPKFDATLPELPEDAIDNNCNGQTDESAAAVCDGSLGGGVDAEYAKAIDLCTGVVSSTFTTLSDPLARSILPKFGTKNLPQAGSRLVMLSTGVALPEDVTSGFVAPQAGKNWNKTAAFPAGSQCKSTATSAFDLIEWKLVLTVPTSAHSFTFDLSYFSSEYPEYLSTQYSDHLLVLLDSQGLKGNVLFDDTSDCFGATAGLIQVCKGCSKGDAALAATGYEIGDALGAQAGGSTGWMTAAAPVAPGETITLRFLLFDMGDGVYDTAVLLDRLRWSGAVLAKPTLKAKP